MKSLIMKTCFRNLTTKSPRVLVTGALGQLGSGVVKRLRGMYGTENVFASDIRKGSILSKGAYAETQQDSSIYLDVMNRNSFEEIIVNKKIDFVIHYSALLSYVGELQPKRALDVNMNAVQTLLELANIHKLRVMVPSTIGVFGPETPRQKVPDIVVSRPTTIYGITKIHNELIGQWYSMKHGVDFRSIRYPGILSSDTLPGGGTTDYALDMVHILFKNIQKQLISKVTKPNLQVSYSCPIGPERSLPMMDIEDCLDITVKLMDLDFEHIRKSGGSKTWNVNGLSFSPKEWEHAVNNYLSKVYFSSQNDSNGTLQASLIVSYATLDPIRDAIAASWPESLDDSRLRTLVRWKPRIETISQLAEKLITELAQYYNLSIVPK